MKRLLTSCFGLGKLPWAPGTWGSLPPVVLYQALAYITAGGILPLWFHPLVHVMLILFGSWVCIQFAPAVIAATGKSDPRQVVADEVAGQALTMLAIVLAGPVNICNTTVLGFALFRLFDVAKPWPIRKIEKLPAGWGILADDLAAALYAAALSLLAIHFLPAWFG